MYRDQTRGLGRQVVSANAADLRKHSIIVHKAFNTLLNVNSLNSVPSIGAASGVQRGDTRSDSDGGGVGTSVLDALGGVFHETLSLVIVLDEVRRRHRVVVSHSIVGLNVIVRLRGDNHTAGQI